MDHKNLFCAWTGGHECSLSLHHALKSNTIKCLITPIFETGTMFRSILIHPSILRAQADLLKIPLLILNTSTDEYEAHYKQTLTNLKKHKIEGGIFPFINNEVQKQNMDTICTNQLMTTLIPLWQRDKNEILSEFIELGFKAKIIAVNEKYLNRDFLSKDLDKDILKEFNQRKIDMFGENGEFHTVLYDAPYFSSRLNIKEGDITLKNGNWTLDITLLS